MRSRHSSAANVLLLAACAREAGSFCLIDTRVETRACTVSGRTLTVILFLANGYDVMCI